MTPSGRFNLGMGTLVAVALVFGFWRWRQQAESAQAISARIAAQEEDAHQAITGDSRGPLPAAGEHATPLPAWSALLPATELEVLRRKADQGDGRAACRVGLELARCAAMPGRCGTPPLAAPAPSAAAYLRQAAQAGNRDAMVRYAMGPFPEALAPADGGMHYAYLHDPDFEDWHRDAVGMAERALHAGDPLAALLLARAYADDDSLFDALVPDDPTQARAYALLVSFLRGAPAPPGALETRQEARAQMQAQRLYREAFASQPVAGGLPEQPDLLPAADAATAQPCQ